MYGNARIDVGADEEAVRLAEEPERGVHVVLEELEQPDDEDDRRHDERHERDEADDGPQPRQLQVHPVEGRHEQEQADDDRLQREPERELDRRPELRVVEDEAVARRGCSTSRSVASLMLKRNVATSGSMKYARAEQQPDDGRGGDRAAAHLAHLAARRCSGT